MYKHILVATDGSEAGQKGLDHGLSLAKSQGARVTIITVTEPFPLYAGDAFGLIGGGSTLDEYGAGQQEAASAILRAASQAAGGVGLTVETVQVADMQPAEAIIDAAKSRGCDLIVMGSHGRRGVGRLLLGSKAWEVVSHSPVPVLIVR
jgi:nucleotide-binding universal stress UspA family protein